MRITTDASNVDVNVSADKWQVMLGQIEEMKTELVGALAGVLRPPTPIPIVERTNTVDDSLGAESPPALSQTTIARLNAPPENTDPTLPQKNGAQRSEGAQRFRRFSDFVFGADLQESARSARTRVIDNLDDLIPRSQV